MNILHFGSNYLPNQGGNVVRMRKMLEDNKYTEKDNIFVYTHAKPSKDFNDELYYKTKNIKIIRFDTLKIASKNIKKIIKSNNIDIIVTHNIPATIIACLTIHHEVPIMVEVHSLIQSSKFKMIGKKLLHRLFINKRVSKYFVLSNGAKNYLIKEYRVNKKDIVFLPNGFEEITNSEVVIKEFEKQQSDFFTFGYVGTFYSWQGIDLIIENIDNILDIASNIRIYFVGDGEQYTKLKEISSSSKYKNKIIVTGMVAKEEVDKHMEQIDVMLIPRPSTLETETAIPLKIFEGVSYKKPLIISNVSGLTEVLNDTEAFIFNFNSKYSLSDACAEAYNDRQLCMKKVKNASKKLKKWPSWNEIHKKQYIEFLKKLN